MYWINKLLLIFILLISIIVTGCVIHFPSSSPTDINSKPIISNKTIATLDRINVGKLTIKRPSQTELIKEVGNSRVMKKSNAKIAYKDNNYSKNKEYILIGDANAWNQENNTCKHKCIEGENKTHFWIWDDVPIRTEKHGWIQTNYYVKDVYTKPVINRTIKPIIRFVTGAESINETFRFIEVNDTLTTIEWYGLELDPKSDEFSVNITLGYFNNSVWNGNAIQQMANESVNFLFNYQNGIIDLGHNKYSASLETGTPEYVSGNQTNTLALNQTDTNKVVVINEPYNYPEEKDLSFIQKFRQDSDNGQSTWFYIGTGNGSQSLNGYTFGKNDDFSQMIFYLGNATSENGDFSSNYQIPTGTWTLIGGRLNCTGDTGTIYYYNDINSNSFDSDTVEKNCADYGGTQNEWRLHSRYQGANIDDSSIQFITVFNLDIGESAYKECSLAKYGCWFETQGNYYSPIDTSDFYPLLTNYTDDLEIAISLDNNETVDYPYGVYNGTVDAPHRDDGLLNGDYYFLGDDEVSWDYQYGTASNNITVCALVNFTTVAAEIIVDNEGSAGIRLMHTAHNPYKLDWRVGGCNMYGFDTGDDAYTYNEIHFVCALSNGTHTYKYVDGDLGGVKTCAANINAGNYDLHIGEQRNNIGDVINGSVDEIMIWSRALSMDELYNLSQRAHDSLVHEVIRTGNSSQTKEKIYDKYNITYNVSCEGLSCPKVEALYNNISSENLDFYLDFDGSSKGALDYYSSSSGTLDEDASSTCWELTSENVSEAGQGMFGTCNTIGLNYRYDVLQNLSEFTILTFAKRNEGGEYKLLQIAQQTPSYDDQLTLAYASSNRVNCGFSSDLGYLNGRNFGTYQTDYPVMIGCRYNGSMLSAIYNGSVQTNGDQSTGDHLEMEQIYIGNDRNSNDHFDGVIGRIVIFGRALSDDEIAELNRDWWDSYGSNTTIDGSGTTTLDIKNGSTFVQQKWTLYGNSTDTNILYSSVGQAFSQGSGGAPPSDSCTYSGSGNWEIDCSDYCNITSSVNASNNIISFINSGEVRFNNSITCGDMNYPPNGCTLYIQDGANIALSGVI